MAPAQSLRYQTDYQSWSDYGLIKYGIQVPLNYGLIKYGIQV